jgi:hypothetical protein
MPISNQIGASSLIRPGVIDSAATRPASPFTGQCIFQTDTNQLLVWNGTAWVIPNSPAQNPQGLELVKTQTIGSAVSSVTVSDVFSSTYDNYKIIIQGGVGSTVASVRMTLGATNTGYYWAGYYVTYASTTVGGQRASNSSFWLITGMSPSNISSTVEVNAPNLAKTSSYSANNQVHATDGDAGVTNGYLNDTTQYTSFTITTGSGTMTGGTIRVYGFRNS